MIQLIQLKQARMNGASQLPTVSLHLTAVGITTRVAVGASKVRKLETFALIVHRYSTRNAWITNISGIHLSRAIRPPLTTNLPTFSQIYWQIQHRHMPINLLSQPLVIPSPFLTVTDCKPVSDCCQSNDKSSCRCCRWAKVGNTCTNCLPLWPALHENLYLNWICFVSNSDHIWTTVFDHICPLIKRGLNVKYICYKYDAITHVIYDNIWHELNIKQIVVHIYVTCKVYT